MLIINLSVNLLLFILADNLFIIKNKIVNIDTIMNKIKH